MQTIYTIAGGQWLTRNLNAIAAFMNTRSWDTIEHIALILSVVVVGVVWVQRHNIMDMVGWVFVLVFVSLLVNIRVPVQVIDNSDLTKVYKVDGVPVGLALPASLTTSIGNAMVKGYEMVFAEPDSVTYSKTGMLFGANLVSRSTDFVSQNPDIANLFTDYVQNCVTGDIYLNRKYTLEELMNSTDPYTIIFSKPSPLRGVYDKTNTFRTCAEAATSLKSALALDTQTGGKTWSYYVRQLFGGRPNPDALFSQMVGDSYSFFYGSAQSAGQIIRQNVTMNALREGLTSYAARNGDTASLVNIATTSSMEKQRLSHASIGQVALRTLPMMQTILLGIAIGIFPILVIAGMFNAVTLSVAKGYVFALMWLQTWPLLYAVLNSAMVYYGKLNGSPVVLSELSQVQLKYSDLATTAGYISAMIPPVSWMMIKGLGSGFSSAYSHFASSSAGQASTAASGVVDGNYSLANMQTENVSGYSWNTNSSTSFGQLSHQLANGGTGTQTRDGSIVWDTSGAMSKLPVDINVGRQIASAQQQMARESDVQAESALHGYNDSVTSAWNTLKQFGNNMGTSASMTTGADTTESSQDSMARSKMWNAVVANAKANNISNEQSFQNLMDESMKGSMGAEVYGSVKWNTGDQLGGKLGKWATGLSAEAGARVSGSGTASTGSTDTVSQSGRHSEDNRHDTSSQAAKDFREASDYFTSRKTSTSGNVTDNNAASRVDQFAASLSSAQNSYDQYTSSVTRSHEYSEMASRTESMSGQMSENLTQQFANFVQKQAPQNAEAILTDTGSPDIAAQREALAREFVKTQIAPKVDGAYHDARDTLGAGMTEVNAPGGRQDVMSDYRQHAGSIDTMTKQAGIKDDVDNRVNTIVSGNKQAHLEARQEITHQGDDVKKQHADLESEHKTEGNKFNARYNEEMESQRNMPSNSNVEEFKDKLGLLEKKSKE
ncbi:TPA: conjugal transfer mating-pair stabilization protein TraG [Enterobacter roggenkampii]